MSSSSRASSTRDLRLVRAVADVVEYLRTLLLFYRRHLRVQRVRELMAVLGVAAGVALLFAVQVAHRSVTGSFEQIVHGVAGNATLEVASRGPEGFNQRVAQQVGAMPVVKAVAPILEQPVVAMGPNGRRALTLFGATEELTLLGGVVSKQFLRASKAAPRGTLLLTEATARALGVRPGQEVTILVRGGSQHLRLAAVVPSAKIGPVAESPVAMAPLPVVQALSNLAGRVTRVLIEPRAGHEAALAHNLVARYGARLDARPIDTEARLLDGAAAPEKQVTLLFGDISLIVGVILAYNALLLASGERRRFMIYLLRTGAPDSMIAASLAFDALILGLAGSALGLLGGDLISLIAFRPEPGYIAAAFTLGGQRVTGASTLLLALAGGMLAAFVATGLALVTLRAGAATEPDAVGRVRSRTRRLAVFDAFMFAAGAALACASLIVSTVEPASTVVALVGLATGLVMCLPMILRLLLLLAHVAARHSGDAPVRLSVAELRGSHTRSVALLAAGAIAVFLTVVIGGSVADIQRAIRNGATDLLSGGSLWIRPGGAENVYSTQPFEYRQTQRRLKGVPAVASALPWRNSFLDLAHRRVWVLGVPPQLRAQILPSQIVQGSLAIADRHMREGGWVAISQPIAREHHLRLGELFTFRTPSGNASFRLAATIANYGWLPGAIVMNGDDHARLWGGASATQFSVTLKRGVSDEEGRRAIETALPPGSALVVRTVTERREEASAVLGGALSRLSDTTIIAMIAAVVSVMALVVAAIWQRRDRLDLLNAIGMGFGQFLRLVFLESGLVLLVGCLIGMAAGLGGQKLIDGWAHETTGSAVRFEPAWELGLRACAIAGVISILASIVAVTRLVGFTPWAPSRRSEPRSA